MVTRPGLTSAVGAGIEDLLRRRHRRRLRRLGHARVVQVPAGGWADVAPDQPPPRSGSDLEVLIDGSQALPAMAQAIEQARSYVHLAAWHLTPDLALRRGSEAGGAPVGRHLTGLLSDAATRGVSVRILLWRGAPVPSFHPNRWDNRRAASALRSHGLRCVLDDRVPLTGACHEKAMVVDGETAFVGGIEPTDLLGDRFDAREHPDRGQIGWHDMTTRLHGPVVADVAGHFALRWRAMTGEALEQQGEPGSTATAGRIAVQLTRTVPERSYPGLQMGEFGVLESHLRALRAAQRLVYAESQYLWSTEIVAELAALLRDPPHAEFRVLLMLPAEPLAGIDDTHGQVAVLERADAGAGRFLACTPRGRWPDTDEERMVYVHAKVMVVDNRWMSIGSANLNDQSLLNNTELNVVTDDATLVTGTRHRLWAEHLDTTVETIADDPVRVVDQRWRPLAERELDRYRAGVPPGHPLRRLPGAPGNGRRLLGPAQSLVLGA